MDSISPDVVRTAANHSDTTGALTFLGKLMERFWFGTTAAATTQRRYHRTPAPRLAP